MTKKDKYDGFDVVLTYALLICGIALDSIALLMFFVSDWTIARLRDLKEDLDEKDTHADEFFNWILGFKTLKWRPLQDRHEVLDRKFIFRRWSEYVHAYNMVGFCLRIRPKKIHPTKGIIHSFFDCIIQSLYIGIAFNSAAIRGRQFGRYISDLSKRNLVLRTVLQFGIFLGGHISNVLEFFGVKDLYEEIMFTVSDRLSRDLWELIFTEVKQKHLLAEDQESAKGITSAIGNWILVETSNKDGPDHKELLKYVTEKDYDQSIFLWHIATELFYQDQEDETNTRKEENSNQKPQEDSYRELRKILSDYMMYLLMMQPTLMSAVSGIAKIRFGDTCQEAKEFFKRRHVNKTKFENNDLLLKEACKAILSVNTDVSPISVKGDKSKSVLFDASILAEELKRLRSHDVNIWEVVSKVWVELLCYAATHCDSKEHASQLSKGGELINFVWLLMAHFGFGDHPSQH